MSDLANPALTTAAERLALVRREIEAAARQAKRDPASVTLVAISKTFDAAAIEPVIAAGQRVFGENRVQEAKAKWLELRERHPGIELHLVGALQSNKARDAVTLFDVIHSIDRQSLLDALVKEAEKLGRFPSVYVQVNIGDEEQKGGCPIAEVGALVETVRASPLPLAGLMCIPPLGLDPSPFFALLAKLASETSVPDAEMMAPFLGAHVNDELGLFEIAKKKDEYVLDTGVYETRLRRHDRADGKKVLIFWDPALAGLELEPTAEPGGSMELNRAQERYVFRRR